MFENFLSALGLDCELLPNSYRYTVYGKTGGLFEGVKIESYSLCEVVFLIRGGKIIVKGKNITVRKYLESETALSGEITSVEIK